MRRVTVVRTVREANVHPGPCIIWHNMGQYLIMSQR